TMPPIEQPPATPQDAICRDLLRPRITVSISVAPAPSAKRAHPGERPHGGEPTIRVLRDASAFASSSDSTNRFKTLVHEPWRVADWKHGFSSPSTSRCNYRVAPTA